MPRVFPFGTLTYADTSVYGGLYDARFEAASTAFFELVQSGRFRLVISPVLDDEIQRAPAEIVSRYRKIKEIASVTAEETAAFKLRAAYLEQAIVTAKWANDALHVASAAAAGCKIVVSWNMHHIVHFEKIRQYNAVNILMGFEEMAIHTPEEVVYEE